MGGKQKLPLLWDEEQHVKRLSWVSRAGHTVLARPCCSSFMQVKVTLLQWPLALRCPSQPCTAVWLQFSAADGQFGWRAGAEMLFQDFWAGSIKQHGGLELRLEALMTQKIECRGSTDEKNQTMGMSCQWEHLVIYTTWIRTAFLCMVQLSCTAFYYAE